MHNIKDLRKNIDIFREGLKRRFIEVDFNNILELDKNNRELIQKKFKNKKKKKKNKLKKKKIKKKKKKIFQNLKIKNYLIFQKKFQLKLIKLIFNK